MTIGSCGKEQHETRTIEKEIGQNVTKIEKISYAVDKLKYCKTENARPAISDSLKHQTSDLSYSLPGTTSSTISLFECQKNRTSRNALGLPKIDHGTEEATFSTIDDTRTQLTSQKDLVSPENDHMIREGETSTSTSGSSTGLWSMTEISNTSPKGISTLCAKLKDEVAQLATQRQRENSPQDLNENDEKDFPSNTPLKGISELCKKLKEKEAQITTMNRCESENSPLQFNENYENSFPTSFSKSCSKLPTVENVGDGSQEEREGYSTAEANALADSSECYSSIGDLAKTETKSTEVQDTQANDFSDINVDREEEGGYCAGILASDTFKAVLPFTTFSKVSSTSSNLSNQNLQVSQSKYGELLAVIEEIGKDIRPTYAGSKNASERLKKGIMHARALVRECLIETERCARQ